MVKTNKHDAVNRIHAHVTNLFDLCFCVMFCMSVEQSGTHLPAFIDLKQQKKN